MEFIDILKELGEGKTLEQIIEETMVTDINEEILVECIGNEVYEDDDLESFLESISAEIEEFGAGYAVIRTDAGDYYEVPYEERGNRFGDDLPDEIILNFDVEKIYNVTENRN